MEIYIEKRSKSSLKMKNQHKNMKKNTESGFHKEIKPIRQFAVPDSCGNPSLFDTFSPMPGTE